MNKKENDPLRNILSVFLGVATSFFLGIVLIFLSGMLVGYEDRIAAMMLFLIIGIFIPTFTGGFVCGYISNRKDNILPVIISFILIFILSLNNDFKFTVPAYKISGVFILTVLFTYLGGIAGKNMKKKISR